MSKTVFRISILGLVATLMSCGQPDCASQEIGLWTDAGYQCVPACTYIDTGMGVGAVCPDNLTCTGYGSSCKGCKDAVEFCE